MVEAAGIEPASESARPVGPTCVAPGLFSVPGAQEQAPGRSSSTGTPLPRSRRLGGSAGIDDGGDGRPRRATGLRVLQRLLGREGELNVLVGFCGLPAVNLRAPLASTARASGFATLVEADRPHTWG